MARIGGAAWPDETDASPANRLARRASPDRPTPINGYPVHARRAWPARKAANDKRHLFATVASQVDAGLGPAH